MPKSRTATLAFFGVAALILALWEAVVDIPAAGGGLWCFDWRGPCSAGLAAVLIEMFLTVGVVLGYGAFLYEILTSRHVDAPAAHEHP